jgi:pumilio RNA-binding family
MNKLGVPQQSQPQQLGLQAMNNVHMPYEIHPMQLKVIIIEY